MAKGFDLDSNNVLDDEEREALMQVVNAGITVEADVGNLFKEITELFAGSDLKFSVQETLDLTKAITFFAGDSTLSRVEAMDLKGTASAFDLDGDRRMDDNERQALMALITAGIKIKNDAGYDFTGIPKLFAGSDNQFSISEIRDLVESVRLFAGKDMILQSSEAKDLIAVAQSMDADKDGSLDDAERAAFMAKIKEADADKNGYLGPTELSTLKGSATA